MKINVIGASGQLGSRIVEELAKLTEPENIIASARNPQKLGKFKKAGIETRHADYDNPESMKKAFSGTESLVLIPSFDSVEQRIQQQYAALQAAKENGVRKIVQVSLMHAGIYSRFYVTPYFLYTESKLIQSDFDWVILRNSLYLGPLAEWAPDLAKTGELPYPVKSGKISYVSHRDLARAAAAACLKESANGAIFELSGSAALSMPRLAEILSEAAGANIKFRQVSEGEFAEICRKGGEPEELTNILITLYRAADNGEYETVSNHIEKLTGKPPEGALEFLKRKLS